MSSLFADLFIEGWRWKIRTLTDRPSASASCSPAAAPISWPSPNPSAPDGCRASRSLWSSPTWPMPLALLPRRNWACPHALYVSKGRRRAEHDAEVLACLKEHRVDLVCLAGYMRLLSPGFVAAYPNRIVNIHPSLLPAFPGLEAQEQAFAYGVKIAGCTVHFVDEELDHGAIILQRAIRGARDRRSALACRAHSGRGTHGLYRGVADGGQRRV